MSPFPLHVRPLSAFLRALLVVSLALAAFAHRPAAIAKAEYRSLAYLVLPDGTLPDICAGIGNDPGESSSIAACPFCVLAGAMLLPPIAGHVLSDRPARGQDEPLEHAYPNAGRPFVPAAPPQGPPVRLPV